MIIADHARVDAARQAGLELVPTICVTHLSEDKIRAYILADNKIADNADWDPDLLRVELEYLSQVDIDLDVDLTGFSMPEIDLILAPENVDGNEEDSADVPPSLPEPNAVICQLGDLWHLGPHRVLCAAIAETARRWNNSWPASRLGW
jgi:ParB-like chromosome segregation protein Spo0J